jgi:hypothetical protein
MIAADIAWRKLLKPRREVQRSITCFALVLQELDPTGQLAFRLLHIPAIPVEGHGGDPGHSMGKQCGLLVLLSPDRRRLEAAGERLNAAIRGTLSGYLLGLAVKGVGYRMEPLLTGELSVQVCVTARRPLQLRGPAAPRAL